MYTLLTDTAVGHMVAHVTLVEINTDVGLKSLLICCCRYVFCEDKLLHIQKTGTRTDCGP